MPERRPRRTSTIAASAATPRVGGEAARRGEDPGGDRGEGRAHGGAGRGGGGGGHGGGPPPPGGAARLPPQLERAAPPRGVGPPPHRPGGRDGRRDIAP